MPDPDRLREEARLRKSSLPGLTGSGRKYASVIQAWQAQALFSDEVEWAGPMTAADARRTLELKGEIDALEVLIARIATDSEIAQHTRR